MKFFECRIKQNILSIPTKAEIICIDNTFVYSVSKSMPITNRGATLQFRQNFSRRTDGESLDEESRWSIPSIRKGGKRFFEICLKKIHPKRL